jgi:hypothetical protein
MSCSFVALCEFERQHSDPIRVPSSIHRIDVLLHSTTSIGVICFFQELFRLGELFSDHFSREVGKRVLLDGS